jgi:hypothetical protein
MKILITETDETDQLLDDIANLCFVDFTRDGEEVAVHLTQTDPYNIASVFILLTKSFPDLKLRY